MKILLKLIPILALLSLVIGCKTEPAAIKSVALSQQRGYTVTPGTYQELSLSVPVGGYISLRFIVKTVIPTEFNNDIIFSVKPPIYTKEVPPTDVYDTSSYETLCQSGGTFLFKWDNTADKTEARLIGVTYTILSP